VNLKKTGEPKRQRRSHATRVPVVEQAAVNVARGRKLRGHKVATVAVDFHAVVALNEHEAEQDTTEELAHDIKQESLPQGRS
jgi:hypothetical protein